jgi:hypothetical protein
VEEKSENKKNKKKKYEKVKAQDQLGQVAKAIEEKKKGREAVEDSQYSIEK